MGDDADVRALNKNRIVFGQRGIVAGIPKAANARRKGVTFPLGASQAAGKFFTPAVTIHILKNHFYENDLESLLSSYDEWEDRLVQNAIFDLVKPRIAKITSAKWSISENLLEDLLSSPSLPIDEKKNLLLAQITKLDKDECARYFDIAEFVELGDLLGRRESKIEKNDLNGKFLTAFKNQGWISDFKVDTESTTLYEIIENKPIGKSSGTGIGS